jgi:SAM-dependent methyltransferase
MLDPDGWISWEEVRHVLCLASGGGQQAPLFASLDCRVVSADLSPEQLRHDQRTARRYGFEIECVEADMLGLSALYARDFDLVYQAVSACYVPNVRRLYAEISKVLKPGGYYRVEHWNPVSMQLSGDLRWTGRGYELTSTCISGWRQTWKSVDASTGAATVCWHYIHSLADLIGGLCDTGFHILNYAERGQGDYSAAAGSGPHVEAFVRPFFTLYAQTAVDSVTRFSTKEGYVDS